MTDIRQGVSKLCEDSGGQNRLVSGMCMLQHPLAHTNRCSDSEQVSNFYYGKIRDLIFTPSVPGELPPPRPRIFFGRDELIERLVHLAKYLTPVALTGAGGIGKTSIVLTVLHDDQIKQRFGENRRFIRCDEFPATRNHFLRRLSKVIGAEIENPESLVSLRPFLSSREIFLVLDNAESILDPRGSSAQEIYAVLDELTQFSNICVYITSRISTIPPHCETIKVPTLSTAAAQDTFYRIYKQGDRSDQIDDILERLDFHPLSITLLATVAQYNQWDANRLTVEWARQRTAVLDTQHSMSLATTIELSLSSPTFRELGPEARSLLEVVAFLPQGVNEKNTNWLFPTIPGIPNILDKFCVLSLAYRNDGFITMLAPLRDHLRPKDPASSPLLRTAKENYFMRLSGEASPSTLGFEEARWITTEDVNVEHLLDVFTTIDGNLESTWDACAKFMAQLYWHKLRLVTLGPKIEALPDNHPSKPLCLSYLSRLFDSVGNVAERRRVLSHTLKLWRERGDDFQVAQTLRGLSDANRRMGLDEEGIRQAKEASEIFGRLGLAAAQAECLTNLALSLFGAKQLDAAEEAGLHALGLLPEVGEELVVCQTLRVLGGIYQEMGEMEEAILHFKMALEIASCLNMADQLFWINLSLADVFSEQGKFEDAQTHVEHAKSHAADSAYFLAHVMNQQARVWYGQQRFEEARSEMSHALNAFEKLGATRNAEIIGQVLQQIDARRAGQLG